MRTFLVASFVGVVLVGCGGSGNTSSTTKATNASTTKATSVATSSSTGFVPCDDHDDCGVTPGDDVCVFGAGFCAQRCGPGSPPCPPTFVCEPCATSSCPACSDCLGACLQPL
jgi:hypothetical protein